MMLWVFSDDGDIVPPDTLLGARYEGMIIGHVVT